MTTIPVQFVWSVYRPDARQYKQQSIEVMPFVAIGNQPTVEIDLPIELLANTTEYLAKSKDPILSIAAVKYLVDEWEKIFSDPQVSPEDFKAKVEDADWGDDLPKTNSEKVAEQVDTWDEVDKTEKPEEQWDETTEDWGDPA